MVQHTSCFVLSGTRDVSLLSMQPSSTTNVRQYKAPLYYITQVNFVASNAEKKKKKKKTRFSADANY